MAGEESRSLNVKFLADIRDFSSKMQNLHRETTKIGKQMQKAGKTMSLAITAPLAGIAAVSTKTFVDFELSMAKVSAITGETGTKFKELESSALELGRTTQFTASQVAELQLNLAKLGFSPDEINNSTASILDLALAFDEDLGQSATVAASTMRAFGLEADDMGMVVDTMAASFAGSGLDLAKFETAMSTVAPVAKTAGASLAETSGVLGVLVNNGVDASSAGAALRNVFLDLSDKGLSWADAMEQINNAQDPLNKANELFGKRGAAVATIISQNSDEINRLTTEFTNSEGAARGMAAIMEDTLSGSFAKMKSALEGAAISIGEALAPAMKKVADFVNMLATRFNELSPSVKATIVTIAGVVAAIGPLLIAVGTFMKMLPILKTGIFAVKAALTAMTGPVGLIVMAIAGAVALIIANWDEIVAYFTEGDGAGVWNTLVSIFTSAWDLITDTFNRVVNALKSVWDRFGADIINTAINTWTLWSETATDIWGWITEKWSEFTGWILSIWDEFGGQIIEKAISIWDNLKAGLLIGVNAMRGIFEGVLTQILGIVKIFHGVFTGNWGKVWDGVVDVFAGMINILLSAVGGLVSGMMNQLGMLADAIGLDFGKTLLDGAKDVEKFFDDLKVKSKGAEEAAATVDDMVDAFKSVPSEIPEPKMKKAKKEEEEEKKKEKEDTNFDESVGGSSKVDNDKAEKEKLKKQQKAFNDAVKQEEINLREELQKIEIEGAKDEETTAEEIEAKKLQAKIDSKNREKSLATFHGQEILEIEGEIDEMLHEQEMNAIEQKKIEDEAQKEANKVAVQSGMDGAQSLIGALQNAGAESKALAIADIAINTARGISGAIASGAGIGFPQNLGAIATGVASVVTGMAQAKAALSSAPALAKGGLAFGPTMAMVGDNMGASTDPEVIAPLSKLEGMMGGGGMPDHVTLSARGNALEGTLRRQNQRNRRNN